MEAHTCNDIVDYRIIKIYRSYYHRELYCIIERDANLKAGIRWLCLSCPSSLAATDGGRSSSTGSAPFLKNLPLSSPCDESHRFHKPARMASQVSGSWNAMPARFPPGCGCGCGEETPTRHGTLIFPAARADAPWPSG
jgi:hypothetical protein